MGKPAGKPHQVSVAFAGNRMNNMASMFGVRPPIFPSPHFCRKSAMETNKETRIIRKPLELCAAKGSDGGDVFSGYVFAWDTPSDDLGGFREIIKQGAAAKFLAGGKNLFAVLDHEKHVENVLGDINQGRLKLWEDDKGLAFQINAVPTTAAQNAAKVVGGTDVGMSFGFIAGKEAWSTGPDGGRLRTLFEFSDLDDISIVVDAAYKSSDVTVAKRSLAAAIARDPNQLATSRSQYRAGWSHVWDGLGKVQTAMSGLEITPVYCGITLTVEV